MTRYPKPLENLISHLRSLPGVGKKTAERYAFQILKMPNKDISNFATCLGNVQSEVRPCSECGCFLNDGECTYCSDHSARSSHSLCIVSSVKDVYAIEQTHIFTGLYHVIPKLLSPIDGNYEEQVNVAKIIDRIEKRGIKEVIIALDSTLEGDATSLYIKQQLENLPLTITRLALGLPLGSSLDFVDEGTLNRAFMGRQKI